MEIFLVGGDPVSRDLMLGSRQLHFAAAHFVVHFVFQLVFDVGIPGLGQIRLRPEVFEGIGAAEFQADEMVYFVIAGLV